MNKLMLIGFLALTGCGASVTTTTGENGTVVNRAHASPGTVLTVNPQTGQICIDAAKSGICKASM